jgi:C4-dicarboxylate-specific signal transduction histidine kinase
MDNYQVVIAGILAVIAAVTGLIGAVGVLIKKVQELRILINGNLTKLLDLNERAASATGQLKGKADERSEKQSEMIALTDATVAAKELLKHAADVGKTLVSTATLEAHRLVLSQAATAKTLLDTTAAGAACSDCPARSPNPDPK